MRSETCILNNDDEGTDSSSKCKHSTALPHPLPQHMRILVIKRSLLPVSYISMEGFTELPKSRKYGSSQCCEIGLVPQEGESVLEREL